MLALALVAIAAAPRFNLAHAELPRVTASSVNESNPRYGADNIADDQLVTAWCEGGEGAGIGHWVDFRYPRLVAFTGVKLIRGYAKVHPTLGALYKKNNRLSRVEVTIDGEPAGTFDLKDDEEPRFVALDGFKPRDGHSIRFIIRAVQPGSKWNDTCLSEISPEYQQKPTHLEDAELDRLLQDGLELDDQGAVFSVAKGALTAPKGTLKRDGHALVLDYERDGIKLSRRYTGLSRSGQRLEYRSLELSCSDPARCGEDAWHKTLAAWLPAKLVGDDATLSLSPDFTAQLTGKVTAKLSCVDRRTDVKVDGRTRVERLLLCSGGGYDVDVTLDEDGPLLTGGATLVACKGDTCPIPAARLSREVKR